MNGSTATRSGEWLQRAVVAAGIAAAVALVAPGARQADAHCDSVEGPVVAAARKSLDTGDVKFVLAYVQADAETELTAAFREAWDVRSRAPAARALADRYFFETAVRLHRAGEGAPYTGLTTNPELGPALEAAEQAVATGKQGATQQVIVAALKAGLDRRWHAIETARSAARRNPTVSNLRAQAEAELLYETYVHEAYALISASGHAGESEIADRADPVHAVQTARGARSHDH